MAFFIKIVSLMEQTKEEIGVLIRNIRKTKGLSLMQLAEMIEVSYQQLQKYEKGTDNVSVDRLHQLARALEVPVTIFFPSGDDLAAEIPQLYGKLSDDERLLLELYRRLHNPKRKKAVIELLKSMTSQ